MSEARTRAWAALLLVLFPIAYGLLGIHLGEDVSFDMLNYHYFDPYWLLTNHLYDILPAQEQTYLSPVLNIPTYALQRWLSGLSASFVIATVQGLAIVPLYFIARSITATRLLSLILGALGMLGSIAYSEIGSSFGDNLVAIFLLSALALTTRVHDNDCHSSKTIWLIPAVGLLVGIGAGLKLAEAPIAMGFLLASPTLRATTSGRVVAFAQFLVGLIGGVGISYGYWAYELTTHYGNPVLPFFNQVFRSPFALIAANSDPRFLPQGLLEWMLYPFIWTLHPLRVEEVGFRELSIPLCEALLLTSIALRCYRLIRERHWVPLFSTTYERFLVVGATLSVLIWAYEFGVYRYITSIEMLSFVLLWILAKSVLSGISPRRYSPRLLPAAVAVLCLLCVMFEQPANFGRTHFAGKYFSAQIPTSLAKPNLTILMLSAEPYGYIVPFFPQSTDVIRLQGNLLPTPHLEKLIQQRLNAAGAIYVTWVTVERRRQFLLENQAAWMQFGLKLQANACSQFRTQRGGSGEWIRYCRLEHATSPPTRTTSFVGSEGSDPLASDALGNRVS